MTYANGLPNDETDILGDKWIARLRRQHAAELAAAGDLAALVRACHGSLKVDTFTFDAGQTITIHGYIGRLPYRVTVTREWGDDEAAEDVAFRTLQTRLGVTRWHAPDGHNGGRGSYDPVGEG